MLQCRTLCSVEERGIDNSGEARINIVEDKAVSQPGEVEGEVDGAADGDGAEEVVEDVSLLAGKNIANAHRPVLSPTQRRIVPLLLLLLQSQLTDCGIKT